MSEQTITTTTEVQPTAPLPESSITAYAEASGTELAEIERAIAEVDIEDSNSILFFGSSAQTEVTTVADEMLEGVRNKDTGPAGAALNEMVTTLRGFSLDELDPNKKPGFFARAVRIRQTRRQGAAAVRAGAVAD